MKKLTKQEKRAWKEAVKALRKQAQKQAFSANMARMGLDANPMAIRAKEIHEDLHFVIDHIEAEILGNGS